MNNLNILEQAAGEPTLLAPVNTSLAFISGEDGLCVRASKICKLDQNDANTFVNAAGVDFHKATSKNCFLRFWPRDFVLTKALESPEYCMYCGLSNGHC